MPVFLFLKSKNPVTLEENRTLNINTPMAWVMINFGVEVIVELRNSDLPHLTTLGVNTLFCPFQLFGELGIYEADILGYRPFQLPQWSCVSRLLVYKHSYFPV